MTKPRFCEECGMWDEHTEDCHVGIIAGLLAALAAGTGKQQGAFARKAAAMITDCWRKNQMLAHDRYLKECPKCALRPTCHLTETQICDAVVNAARNGYDLARFLEPPRPKTLMEILT